MAQRAAASKHWIFTIHDPDLQSDALQQRLDAIRDSKYIFQLEAGELGRPHFQGYIVLASKQRISYLRRCVSPRGHYEVARGSPEQNVKYCSKEEGQLEPPRLRGLALHGKNAGVGRGRRRDLEDAVELLGREGISGVVERFPVVWVLHHRGLQALHDIRGRHRNLPQQPEVVWIYGPSGTGKSTLAAYMEPRAYRKNNSKWWDSYDSHLAVVWDDFSGGYPFRDLLVALDRFAVSVETKGSSRQLLAEKFIFTTNQPPWDFYHGVEDTTPLIRRITLFCHVTAWDEMKLFENVNDAKADYY